MWGILRWVALGVVAALVIAGCGGGSGGSGTTADSTTKTAAPDVPAYLEVVEEAAEAKAEGKLPDNLEPGESDGAEGPAGGDCLATVEDWTPEQIETLLALAQRQVEAGGSEPEPGTCGAERLEWMREQVE